MTREPEPSRSAAPAVIRLGEEDWRAWRAVRLAALADAPGAFGSTLEHEQALGEEAWRAMTRGAAIFLAVAGGIPIGVVAGVGRPSAGERGLGAMWVTPAWRSHGVAALLVGAVIDWARDEGCARVGLWVPADNARARRFYERQGFRATEQEQALPRRRRALDQRDDPRPTLAGRARIRPGPRELPHPGNPGPMPNPRGRIMGCQLADHSMQIIHSGVAQ